MNEEFWQRKIERITAERDELADNLRRMGEYCSELRNALQELCDLQCGPPLIRDANRWQTAMDTARNLLQEVAQ